LELSAATGVHEATPPAVTTPAVGGHAMLVQLLASVAGVAVHEATASGAVVIGAGQVVVVQLLPAFGPDAAHERTGTSS
jgi:hypothetical protein